MVGQAVRPPSRFRISISAALRILAALVVGLVVGVVGFDVHTTRQAAVADAQRQMARLDMVFAEQTGRAVQTVDLLVLGAADTANRPNVTASELGKILSRRISGVRQIAGIRIIGADGTTLAVTDQRRAPVPNDTIEAALTAYRQDSHADRLIGRPFRVEPNRWHVLLTRPLRTPDGTLTGIVAGSIDLSYFEDCYRSVELSDHGAIGLHLLDGTLLARSPHDEDAIGRIPASDTPLRSLLSGRSDITAVMDTRGDHIVRIVAIRALQAYPLVVMVSDAQDQLLESWRQHAWSMAIEAIVACGLVFGLLLALANRSRRIERLLDEARAARLLAEQTNDRLQNHIAERERAEDALRQAQRIEAIGQLTGGIAHDFNNLLTVVLGNTEMLRRRAKTQGDEHQSDRLEAIHAAAERGARLTSHLLAFSRRQALMPKPTDLNEMIRGMSDLLDTAIGPRVQIKFQPVEPLSPALVDQGQIELVVLNLALNARDSMPAGGTVTIETADTHRDASHGDGPPAGDYITITVRDTGSGIPGDILARVFEPFFTTKSPVTNSGLGLSQVFGTVRQSGGEVRIQTRVGSGTAVSIDLPRALAQPQPATRPSPHRQARILLVDDNEPVRTVAATILTDLGHTVLQAGDGETALSMLDDTIDLLVSDLAMPGMSGTQLAAAARDRRPDLPIVFVSGYGGEITVQLGPHDDLLDKPFDPEELARAVTAALGKSRLTVDETVG